MKLEDLSPDMKNFDELEMECLDNLEVSEEGLKELLDYLEGIDSVQGWMYLLETFDGILEDDDYKILLEKARKVLDIVDELYE